MIEILCKLINLWKKNISFLLAFLLLLVPEISYITSVQGTETADWYQCINYFYVFLLTLPSLVAVGYIIFMRNYIPKAKKNTRGIAFYIVNANEKQYDAIKKKFIAQFKEAVNSAASEYSVVIIDDYHSQKYYSLMCEPTVNNDGQKQAKILEKRRCCVAILINCINGGDGEELFCRMTTTLGVTHNHLPQEIREFLIRDISTALLPLREVDIMKMTETPDFSKYSVSMEVICQYVLASTRFACGDFSEAKKLLETIDKNISLNHSLPDAVLPIKNALCNRIAICCRIQAQYEYQMYCSDHDIAHLIAVRDAIKNDYCRRVYEKDNKIFEGICAFVLDRNVNYAIQCMDAYNKKDPVIKYNKVFLFLYGKCTLNNIGRTYNLYKNFGTLPENAQEQIESFTYYEYQQDTSKKQLLLILFFIYDYQNNNVLAKRCLDQFCTAFPWVYKSEVSAIFEELNRKYKSVEYEEGETYSI